MSFKPSCPEPSPHNDEHVIEVPRIIRQERIHHRPVEQIVEVPVPEIMEEIVEVPAVIHKARALQRNVEQVVEIAVPEVVEDTVEIPKLVKCERVRQRSVEKFTDIPVPQVVEERVEMPVIVPQIRIRQRMVEHYVDVPVPQVVEEATALSRSVSPLPQRAGTQNHGLENVVQEDVVEVPKIVVMERVKQRTVEHFVDVPVPQIVEEVEEVETPVVLQSVTRNVVPQVVDVPVPEIVEELVELVKEVVQDRVHVQAVERVVDVPVPQIVEEVVEVQVPQRVERVQQRMVEVPLVIEVQDEGFPWLRDEVAKAAQHSQVDKPKVTPKIVQRGRPSPVHHACVETPPGSATKQTVDVPQIQWVDRFVDVPFLKQVEVPAIKKVQKLVEVPQIQWVDQKLDVPRIKQVQVPAVQTAQTKAEVLQVEWVDKVIDVPVVKQRSVPVIQKVQSIIEIPRVEFVDEVVSTPVLKKRQVPMLQRVNKMVEVDVEPMRGRSPTRATQVPMIQDVYKLIDADIDGTHRSSASSEHRKSARTARVRKIVEIPCIQWVEQVVDVPVIKQRHVPVIQKVKKVISKPQIEWESEVVDCPELKLRQVPAVQVVKKTVEVPKITYSDTVIEAPTIKVREVPSVKKVQKVVEVPQIEYVDKFVDVPFFKDVARPNPQTGSTARDQQSPLPHLRAGSTTPTRQGVMMSSQIAPLRSPPRTPIRQRQEAVVVSPSSAPPAAGASQRRELSLDWVFDQAGNSSGSRPVTPGSRPVTPGSRPLTPCSRPVTGSRPVTPQRLVASVPHEILRVPTPKSQHQDIATFTTVAGLTASARCATVLAEGAGIQEYVQPQSIQKGIVVPQAPDKPSEEVDAAHAAQCSIEAPSLADSMASGSWPPGNPDAPRQMRLADGWLGSSSMQDVLSLAQFEEKSSNSNLEAHTTQPEEHGNGVASPRDDDVFSGRLLTTYTTDFALIGSHRQAPWESENANSARSNTPPSAWNFKSAYAEEHNHASLGAHKWNFEAEDGSCSQSPTPVEATVHSAVVSARDDDMFSARLLTTYITDLEMVQGCGQAPWEMVVNPAEDQSNNIQDLLPEAQRVTTAAGPCNVKDPLVEDLTTPRTQETQVLQRWGFGTGPSTQTEDPMINGRGFAVGARVRAQFKDEVANRITNTRYPGCVVSRNNNATYGIKYDDGSYWNSVPEICMELEVQ